MKLSDKKRFIATILIISLFVVAFASFVYVIYRLSGNHKKPQISPFPNRSYIEQLLYGSDKAIACGTQLNVNLSKSVRVVGGRSAVYGEVPWFALLYDNTSSTWDSCGGSIIGNRWILTAAHCVNDLANLNEKFFLLGTFNLSNPSNVTVNIDSLFIHPDFNNTGLNSIYDIALIKTVQRIDLTAEKYPIGPVCLPESRVEPSGNVTVAGFGDMGQLGNATILQVATMPIVNHSICVALIEEEEEEDEDLKVFENMLCAGYLEGGVDMCSGDSGGPLVQFGTNNSATLVGIVSWGGVICALHYSPGVYTQVSDFVDWIYNTIEKNLL